MNVMIVECLSILVLCMRIGTVTAIKEVHAFYYLWYGDPFIDNEFKHWNHEVLPHWEDRINQLYPQVGQRFQPPFDLHSPFYPTKGPYSSKDPEVMKQHFREILYAGIDVIVASWWGQETKPTSTDTQGVNTDRTIKKLLEVAEEFNREQVSLAENESLPSPPKKIKIAFHLEPYPGRTIESVKEDVEYVISRYGHYSSFYRDVARDNLPLFYVYDSYHIESYNWARLLTKKGDLTLRKTKHDGIFIGLWLHPQHGRELQTGGFDGAYSYFATDGFSYGSTTQNWKSMSSFCRKNQMVCSLSVGPGYNDSLIRPWNDFNSRDREQGKYYERMWKKALGANPDYVSITTFNEWGEGTQIEPAKSYVTTVRSYLSYKTSTDPNRVNDYLYLNMTLSYSQQFKQTAEQPPKQSEL